jgi:hypothetical protein
LLIGGGWFGVGGRCFVFMSHASARLYCAVHCCSVIQEFKSLRNISGS